MKLVFPGSFDPITKGHLDIALRGAKLAGTVIIAVFDNPAKRTLFTVDERLRLMSEAIAEVSVDTVRFEFDSFNGLLAEYVRKNSVTAIIRGLRSPSDFEAELPYSIHNRNLSGGVDTLYFASDPEYSHISSSIVKEIASHAIGNGFGAEELVSLVPGCVFEALKKKYSKKVEG